MERIQVREEMARCVVYGVRWGRKSFRGTIMVVVRVPLMAATKNTKDFWRHHCGIVRGVSGEAVADPY